MAIEKLVIPNGIQLPEPEITPEWVDEIIDRHDSDIEPVAPGQHELVLQGMSMQGTRLGLTVFSGGRGVLEAFPQGSHVPGQRFVLPSDLPRVPIMGKRLENEQSKYLFGIILWRPKDISELGLCTSAELPALQTL
ncbi:MAG: hypothetical protein JWO41_475 [Candidatus Saccharibacteria bacterium]|nr:hypothetical protein [Candidatus Saccharibacteria bacterium]